MLLTRVITALVLLPVVLGMIFFASPPVWAGFALVLALAAAWEWARLCRFEPIAHRAFLAFSAALGAGLVTLYFVSPRLLYPGVAQALLWAAAAFWIVGVPAWFLAKPQPKPWMLGLVGALTLLPFWVALVDLHDRGRWLVLAVAVIVWIADIGAYFSGRAFGKRKLAPAISPNKSWEGVYGGLAGVLLYGLVLLAWSSGGFAPTGWWAAFLAALVLLTAVSVLGDLFESWMKRNAGVKDSGTLLPGHGGVLDRIDALISTLPVAALLVSLKGTI
jgi:phosphatidate cytidylyltransferase